MRQLAQIARSYGGLAFIGAPATITDEMERWLFEEGCDGFNVMFPTVPEGLDDFVDKVVPEILNAGASSAASTRAGRSRKTWGLPWS